jgi:hypothetical protein
VQKPDIFLEAIFANGESIQWIFDAKYRIADDSDGNDRAPDDAINQMHRYRDALIHVNKADDGGQEKTRPILGAYVLYPGLFDEAATHNPYDEAIEVVDIGAFPLLPGQPNKWLWDFLVARLGNANMAYTIPEPDKYLAEDSARIAMMGTYLSRYEDLTLAASLGPGRDKAYLERFRQGTAGWYHIPLTTTEKKSIERNVMHEVRHCAIGVHHSGAKERIISHLYDVKSVRLVRRCDMTIEQAGKVDPANNDKYWLVELGYARPLVQPVTMPVRTFKFQLTNATDLMTATDWNSLPKRYALLT